MKSRARHRQRPESKRPSRSRTISFESLESRHLMSGFAAHYDFGTATSPLAQGFTRVSEKTVYSAAQGYGWAAGKIEGRDRNQGTPLTRDFNQTKDGTFVADVPNGRYQIDVMLGDMLYAHDQVGVFLEGSLVDTVTTRGGEVVSRRYQTDVRDSKLTLQIRDLGGRDANGGIQSLEVTSLAPAIPNLAIADGRVIEGQQATRDLVFELSLSSPAPSEVSVQYATSHASANSDDYTPTSGTLRIPAGQSSARILVSVRGDEELEADETFQLNLSNPNGVTLVRSSAVGTIQSDDQPSTLTITASTDSFLESTPGIAATGTVRRTGSLASALSVNLTSSDTSEVRVPERVEIPAGQSSVTFAIQAVDDSDIDGQQVATIRATADRYSAGELRLSIGDNERPPLNFRYDFGTSSSPLAAGFQQVTERTAYSAAQGFGWKAGTIEARDRNSGTALTRDFNQTRDGIFAVDVSNGRYQIDVMLGDMQYAHDQVGVFLEGSLVDSVTTRGGEVVSRRYEVEVGDSQLTLQIKDLGGRDANGGIQSLEVTTLGPVVPKLSVADARIVEGDQATRDLVFTVSLSSPADKEVSVQYATAHATANSDDYTATSGVLRIPAGATSGRILVSVRGDEEFESDETFHLNLSAPNGVNLATSRAVATIQNDDQARTLVINVSTDTFPENTPGTAATGMVRRTGPLTSALTVNLTSSDVSEVRVPERVEIPAGQSSATFAIQATDDQDVDGRQTVTLRATADRYSAGELTLQVVDDEQPPFSAYYDFGTNSSPLSAGFQRVTDRTTYSAALGFGWASGSIGAGDRGGNGALSRDYNTTSNGTFAVDLPNGDYQVDVIMGDAGGFAHDLMGVYVEGQLVDTISTSKNQIVSRTFRPTVRDGQLTLQLTDLGGKDKSVLIEALRILPAGSQSTTYWPVNDQIPGATFTEAYQDRDGFLAYSVTSTYQRSTNTIRVLLPGNYDPNKSYRVVYVLPVESGSGRAFGDGLITVRNSALQNQHNAIFVAPTFSETPWYADHASNSQIWEETYFRKVVVPFVESQFGIENKKENRLLLGFSKSGYGAVSMLLRHPETFGRAAAWDSPLAMSNPTQNASGYMDVLGTTQNFAQNYQITSLITNRGSALAGGTNPRIVLIGYSNMFRYYQDNATIDSMLTQKNIAHIYDPGVLRNHHWNSGWLPGAVRHLFT